MFPQCYQNETYFWDSFCTAVSFIYKSTYPRRKISLENIDRFEKLFICGEAFYHSLQYQIEYADWCCKFALSDHFGDYFQTVWTDHYHVVHDETAVKWNTFMDGQILYACILVSNARFGTKAETPTG